MAETPESRKDRSDSEILLDGTSSETRDFKDIPILERVAHFWLMVGKSFLRNRCLIRASALTYTTLLALVPLLAVGLGVATSLLKTEGGEKRVSSFVDSIIGSVIPQVNLLTKTSGTQEDSDDWDDWGLDATNRDSKPTRQTQNSAGTNLLSRTRTNDPPAVPTPAPNHAQVEVSMDGRQVSLMINGYIKNIQSGTLGVTGMVALIFVVISLLRNIEATFNDIWGVQKGRGWLASIEKYWTTVTLGPVLIVVALGLASGSRASGVKNFFESMPFFSSLLSVFLPFIVLGIAFALFYKAIPNTRVEWTAALVGGAVGGCLWQMNNMFSFIYVSNVMSYISIYGSLGIIPVFLLGLYLSWIIVLFGAQVAYAFQNRLSYRQARLADSINQRGREFIAFRIITLVGIAFHRGDTPPTRAIMAAALSIPTRLVGQILQTLVSNRLLAEVAGEEIAYMPARPLVQITCHDILQAMRSGKGQEVATTDEPTRVTVRHEFDKILQAEHRVAAGTTLQSLVDEAQIHAARAIGLTAPGSQSPIAGSA